MKKVLVADDTKNIRTLLSTCLEMDGYEVITVKDGKEALDVFRCQQIDLAFLDIKMPEISGTEVLRRIRELGITTSVVIMTAFATVKNAVECTKLGAIAYLQKPFTAEKIKIVLTEYEESSVTENKDYIKIAENEIAKELYINALNTLKRQILIDPTNARIYLLMAKAYKGLGSEENYVKFNNVYEVLKNHSDLPK